MNWFFLEDTDRKSQSLEGCVGIKEKCYLHVEYMYMYNVNSRKILADYRRTSNCLSNKLF